MASEFEHVLVQYVQYQVIWIDGLGCDIEGARWVNRLAVWCHDFCVWFQWYDQCARIDCGQYVSGFVVQLVSFWLVFEYNLSGGVCRLCADFSLSSEFR